MPNNATSPALPAPAALAEVTDAGKIRTGAGFKILPPTRHAETADAGNIRTGAGFKLFPR